MAYGITNGPLPSNGDEVDPAVFLEQWISGVNVWNLPPGAFKGGTLQFVWSQTDPPASYELFAGLLWFKRGEGRLYMWDQPDLPSTLTFADAGWIALSDRRELWGYATQPLRYGEPIHFSSDEENFVTNEDQYMTGECDPRPLWFFEHYFGTAEETNAVLPQIFVAMESAASGTIFKALELGFCDILCGSGESGNAGSMVLDELERGVWKRVDPTCGSRCRYMPIATCCDSSGTDPGDEWIRQVYKHMAPLLAINTKQ